MQSLTQPTLLLKPFAQSGDKNTIPSTNTDAQNPQLADLTNGFPPITSEDPSDGGLPPERKDLNGLGYLTTTYDFFYQAGGRFTFSPTVSSAIGGYPLNAALWYTDSNGNSTLLRSTIANNTNNFNNGNFTGWQQEIPVLGWNNVWSGNNTFNGSVSLGSSATVTTPPVSDSSTKVANTSWVKSNMTGIPDYTNRTEFTTAEYTPTSHGIIVVKATGGAPYAEISTNDNFVIVRSKATDSSSGVQVVWAIVKSGDTYKTAGSGTVQRWFIPFT